MRIEIKNKETTVIKFTNKEILEETLKAIDNCVMNNNTLDFNDTKVSYKFSAEYLKNSLVKIYK